MSERKWIDIKANFRSGGANYFAGERLHEPVEQAARWIKAGWASDVSGELPTGVPDVSPKKLSVQDGIHNAAADKA